MQLNISIKKGGCCPGERMKLPELLEAAFLCAKPKALQHNTQSILHTKRNCQSVALTHQNPTDQQCMDPEGMPALSRRRQWLGAAPYQVGDLGKAPHLSLASSQGG